MLNIWLNLYIIYSMLGRISNCYFVYTIFYIHLLLLIKQINSICTPKSDLPNLSKQLIHLEKMYKFEQEQNKIAYKVPYNYPMSMVKPTTSSSLQTLISLSSFEWFENKNSINFEINVQRGAVSLLISFVSEEISWKSFGIIVLVSDSEYREEVYFGELAFNPLNTKFTNQGQQQLQSTLPIPQTHKNTAIKVSTFITKMHLSLSQSQNNNYLYDLVISSEVNPDFIFFKALKNGNNLLRILSINFVIWKEGHKTQVYASNQISVSNLVSSATVYKYLKEHVPSKQLYIYGLAGFRFKQAYKPFGITLKVVEHSIFSITTKQPIQLLLISYFGMSKQPNQLCKNCGIYNYPYYQSQSEGKCVSSCPSGSYKQSYSSGSGCSICSSPSYKTQYTLTNNQCLAPTFAISDNQCPEPNQQYNKTSRKCQCIPGYFDQQGVCKDRCPNSFWNDTGKYCVICLNGTYPWKQIKQCRNCTQHCSICLNQFQCKQCRKGFYATNGTERICKEVCGDGMRFVVDCDDGNLNDGDGCSSKCKVENGYYCNGGNLTTNDKCQKLSVKYIKNQIISIGLNVTFEISPAPKKQYTKNQLNDIILIETTNQGIQVNPQTNAPTIVKLSTYNLPYSIHYIHEQNDLAIINVILNYGGQLPFENFYVKYLFRFGNHQNSGTFLADFTRPEPQPDKYSQRKKF